MIAKDNSRRIIWTNCEPVSANDQAAVLAAFRAQEAIANERWTVNPLSASKPAQWLFMLARGQSIATAAATCGVKQIAIIRHLNRLEKRPPKRNATLKSLRRQGGKRNDQSLWAFVMRLTAGCRNGKLPPFAVVVVTKAPRYHIELVQRFDNRGLASSAAREWNEFNFDANRRAFVRLGYQSRAKKGGAAC